MNEILPIKYIIGSWFLKVISLSVCVFFMTYMFFMCVFRVWLFKDLREYVIQF